MLKNLIVPWAVKESALFDVQTRSARSLLFMKFMERVDSYSAAAFPFMITWVILVLQGALTKLTVLGLIVELVVLFADVRDHNGCIRPVEHVKRYYGTVNPFWFLSQCFIWL